MRIGDFDTASRVLLIAEVGNNHEGSVTLAEELIGLAAEAGAGAVKFQTFIPELYVSRKDESRFERLKKFQLSFSDFERLARVAERLGILFLSTPFDIESAKFLNALVPAFKIGSGENTFYPLLETVAAAGKPIILSGGMLSIEELAVSVALIREIWRERGFPEQLALLHCVSSYPTPREEANLAAIRTLAQTFGTVPGYSDHVPGIDAAALSVACGARIVEKHFTIDKNYSSFRDHQLSADPRELRELVERIHEISLLVGTGEKCAQESERGSTVGMRRTIVAARDLPVGHIIGSEDLTWVRPAMGLPPGEEKRILGKKLIVAVSAGEPITEASTR